MANAGITNVLYLPHRFTILTPNEFPLHPQQGTVFPFPQPPSLTNMPLPGHVACKAMCRAPGSTSPDSKTKIATAVNDMVSNGPRALLLVKRSQPLWNKLRRYGSAHDVPHTWQSNVNAAGIPMNQADRQTQAAAIYGLWAWFQGMQRRQNETVTSEPAVQDQVHAQIMEPLDLLLRVCLSATRKNSSH